MVSCSIGDQMHQRLIRIFEAVVAHKRERKGDGGRSPLSPKATISHYLAAAKTEPTSGWFLSTIANLPKYQRYYIRYVENLCMFSHIIGRYCTSPCDRRHTLSKMFWRWQWEWVTDCANEPPLRRLTCEKGRKREESEISDSGSYAISIFTVGSSPRPWTIPCVLNVVHKWF